MKDSLRESRKLRVTKVICHWDCCRGCIYTRLRLNLYMQIICCLVIARYILLYKLDALKYSRTWNPLKPRLLDLQRFALPRPPPLCRIHLFHAKQSPLSALRKRSTVKCETLPITLYPTMTGEHFIYSRGKCMLKVIIIKETAIPLSRSAFYSPFPTCEGKLEWIGFLKSNPWHRGAG